MGSVVACDLVDPGAELANPSVHSRRVHIAVAGAPGDNANKHPHVPLLADKRASGVTLREEEGRSQCGRGVCSRGQCRENDKVLMLT